MLVLTTDGVVEATNGAGEMYGFDRFEAIVAAGPSMSAEAMLAYILGAVTAFVGGAEIRDDVTAVVVRRSR